MLYGNVIIIIIGAVLISVFLVHKHKKQTRIKIHLLSQGWQENTLINGDKMYSKDWAVNFSLSEAAHAEEEYF